MSQKNKYNIFTKAGFRDSQTRDAHGKWSKKPGKLEDRPCFKEWFKDSKATKPNGDPKTFYHGTTHEFNEFNKERGNPENDFGSGFYFSSSRDDVDTNYDNIGPDLTNRIEQRIDYLENQYNDGGGMTRDDARSQAEDELIGGENKIIPVYLAVKNPVVIGDPVFYADEKETFFTYGYDPETDEYGEESGELVSVMDAFLRAQQGYNEVNWPSVQRDVYNAALDYGGLGAHQLDQIMRNSEGIRWAMDDQGKLAVNEIIRQTFENAGYDGIIDNTVWEKFGQIRKAGRPMPGIYEDTQHIIAFEPGSIKRTDAKSFCHETDIRKSGAIIIDHKAGFRETQSRDRSGKWTDKWSGMKKREKEIKDDPNETAVFVDREGNIIQEIGGTPTSVKIDGVLSDAFWLTHNHPNSSSLSRNDILFLLQNNHMNGIRAIGPDGKVYEMTLKDSVGFYNRYIGKDPISGNRRSAGVELVSYAWGRAQHLADNEMKNYLYEKYADDKEFFLSWKYKDTKRLEATKLLGKHSDRVNWYLANETELGKKLLKYTVYEN